MKGLFVRLPAELDATFTARCQAGGLKKGAVLAQLIREFLAKTPASSDPIGDAEQFGLDLSLLRAKLTHSPTQRLEAHAQALAFAERLRQAKQQNK